MKPLSHPSDNLLLAPGADSLVYIPPGPPILIVAVDTEAEHRWGAPRQRTDNGVRNMREQVLAQRIFDKFNVRPTYLVDYEIATQADGYGPLRELTGSQNCQIGAHLHTWESPPFEEELSEVTTYAHNLPASLQKEKLYRLTEAIASNIGVRPVVYRAGRYGIGEEMAEILRSLGYEIDMSVRPGINQTRQHGPDFRRAVNRPYWFGPDHELLEIPLTVGFCGLFSSPMLPRVLMGDFYDLLSRPGLRLVHGPGILSRLRLLDRISLTPEGIALEDLKRLTRLLVTRGNRVFSFNYHSSSLLPGVAPYVRTTGDLDRFLGKIESYLEYFFGEVRGITMTPSQFRALVGGPRHAAARAVSVVA